MLKSKNWGGKKKLLAAVAVASAVCGTLAIPANLAKGQSNVDIDINGNGIPDINIDINNNGIPDINVDTDGDGKADFNIVDRNDDGVPDLDIDKSGNIELKGNIVETTEGEQGRTTRYDIDEKMIQHLSPAIIKNFDIRYATITLGEPLTYNETWQTQTVEKVAMGRFVVMDSYYTVIEESNVQKDAGRYSMVIRGLDNLLNQTTVDFEIKQKPVEIQWNTPESLVYDGTEKKVYYNVINKVKTDVYDTYVRLNEEGTFSAIDAGDYTAKLTGVREDGVIAHDVRYDHNYTIENGKNTELQWSITPATPIEKIVTTAEVEKGRSLKESVVTEGEIVGVEDEHLSGKYEWVDPDKAMGTDGVEKMRFTPDSKNYLPIEVNVAVATHEPAFIENTEKPNETQAETTALNTSDDAGDAGVKTGDANNPSLWGAVAAGAGAAAAAAVISKRKRAAK